MPKIESTTDQEKSQPKLRMEIKTEWSGLSSKRKLYFVLSSLPVSLIFIPILWKNWTSNWIVNGINNVGDSWYRDLLDTIARSILRGNIKNGISTTSVNFFYPVLITILISLAILYIFIILIKFLPNSSRSLINRSNDLRNEDFGLRPSFRRSIRIFPVVIVTFFVVLIANPGTRNFAYLLLDENNPVEFFSFLFLLLASIQGFQLAYKNRKAKGDILILLFYLGFSLGLFFVGMEEISWGQQYLNFDTPEIMLSSNRQGEFTFHNLQGIQGRSEFFHVFFALGGIVGIWLNSTSRFREIGAPFILVSWFITILVFAGLDLYNDFYPFGLIINKAVRQMSEVTEMLIGISGYLYLWLIKKRLDNTKSSITPGKTPSKLGGEIRSEWSKLRSIQKITFYILLLPLSTLFFMVGWKDIPISWFVTLINNPGSIWLIDILDKIKWALAMGKIKNGVSLYQMRILYPHLIVILTIFTLMYFLFISFINLPNSRQSMINRFRSAFKEELGNRPNLSIGFLFFPVLVVAFYSLLVAIPSTRAFCFLVVSENYPVDIMTFLFLMVGSLLSFYLARKTKKGKYDLLTWMSYLAFALVLLFASMKEISWGQFIMRLKTSDSLSSVNLQNELNMNNLRGLQNRNVIFQMLFSLGGFFGMGINPNSRLSELRVPLILITWLITILVVSMTVLYVDVFPFAKGITWGISEMAEINGLLISITGFLYIWFSKKRLVNKKIQQ